MQKRRSRDRRSEAYKKPRKTRIQDLGLRPGKERKPTTEAWRLRPEADLSTLKAKANEISGLAFKAGHTSLGPDGFTHLLQFRKALERTMKQYSTFSEKKEAILRILGNQVKGRLTEMNQWLEDIGKPYLKMSLDEAIHMILD